MAELVDAPDLGSGELACAGSSPVPGIHHTQSMSDHRRIRLAANSNRLVACRSESANPSSAAGAVWFRVSMEKGKFKCRFDFP